MVIKAAPSVCRQITNVAIIVTTFGSAVMNYDRVQLVSLFLEPLVQGVQHFVIFVDLCLKIGDLES